MSTLKTETPSPLSPPAAGVDFHWSRRLTVAALAIVAAGLLVIRILLWRVGNDTFDLATAYVLWQDYIIEHGRWHALATPVGMYFPAYYDLTTVTSYLDGPLDRFAQIKLVSFCFDIFAAFAAYQLAGRLLSTGDQRNVSARRLVAPFTILAGPTVILNGAVWGQCDIVFTSFLILCVSALLVESSALAVLFFGIALAFKLQAIFFAPFLLSMLLSQRIRWKHLWLLPVGWLAAMVPPLLNGARWSSYLGQFGGQTGAFHRLAIDIGNPWALAQWAGLTERVGVPIGIAFTGVLCLVFGWWGRTSAFRTPVNTCALAALSAGVMPYFLPKMGNRYFFTAELLLCLVSCADLAFVLPAALVLTGSLMAYGEYFVPYAKHLALLVAFLANSLGLWLTFRLLRTRVNAQRAPESV